MASLLLPYVTLPPVFTCQPWPSPDPQPGSLPHLTPPGPVYSAPYLGAQSSAGENQGTTDQSLDPLADTGLLPGTEIWGLGEEGANLGNTFEEDTETALR